MQFKSFSDYLVEDAKKEVTFVFGRFNPPTIGHEKLFNQTKKLARSGTYRIYASKSVDPKKNPLPFKDKIKFLRKMFPKHARNVMADKDVRNVLDIATKLYDQGFTKVSMVAGSDRVKEFEVLLNKYNGVKSRHGFYEFEGMVKVLSAGERDPDAEGTSGMSASKMRLAAAQGDLQKFSDGVPEMPGSSQLDLYYAVRRGMGLKKESFRPHVELEKVSDIREDYVANKIFRIGTKIKVKETGEVGKVVIRGANYVLAEFKGMKKRCWLDSIVEEGGAGDYGTDKARKKYASETPGQHKTEIVQSPYNQIVADNTEITFGKKKGKKEGYKDGDSSHGDKNYDSFKTGVKSTDKKRRAQQNRQKDMADDDPKAYKDLPGDKKARKKGLPPSKFTTKYKQMYGESMTFEDYIIENKGQAQKALKKKSQATGVPMSILNKVFDRGYAAWKTGHKPGTTPVQWGLARVNSFLVGGPVWKKFDSDQAELARKAGFSPKR